MRTSQLLSAFIGLNSNEWKPSSTAITQNKKLQAIKVSEKSTALYYRQNSDADFSNYNQAQNISTRLHKLTASDFLLASIAHASFKVYSVSQNIDWSSTSESIPESELLEVTNHDVKLPDYYENCLLHGMEPDSDRQATSERPSMKTLRYLSKHSDIYGLSLELLRESHFINESDANLSLLDIGCGTGYFSKTLLQAFPVGISDLHAVDLSRIKLALFKRTLCEELAKKVTLHHLLGENLVSMKDSSLDRVLVSFVFHELPGSVTAKILQEAHRVLKPDGKLLILDMNKDDARIQSLSSKSFSDNWLRQRVNWLMEPYIDDYLELNFDELLKNIGFKTEFYSNSNIKNNSEVYPISGILATKQKGS